ncbi:MAG TPA: hypothetical protein VGL93_21015 [Streptosporangiaceae bacterium]
MEGSFSAELLKLRKHRGVWLLLLAGVVIMLSVRYAVPYGGYLAGVAPGGRAAVLPGRLVGNAIAMDALPVGAVAFVLGAVSAGGEYGWATLKTTLIQRPSRVNVLAGKVAALGVVVLVLVLAMFAVGAVASAAVASAGREPLTWPPPGALTRGAAAGWLILEMWTVLGALTGYACRGVALPAGLGVAWPLVVEAPLSLVPAARVVLPGGNAGSLVAAVSTHSVAGGGRAALAVAAYLLVAVVASGVLLRRREVR